MADTASILEHLVRAAADPSRATGNPAAGTLNDGFPGSALFLAVLSSTDSALAQAAEEHWDTAAGLLAGASPSGIYKGPGALAASLIVGAGYVPCPHHTAVERAASWLSARAQSLSHHQRTRLRSGLQGAPWGVYDAIRGLSGIGRILLAADQLGHSAVAEPGLTAALTTLTDMINMSVKAAESRCTDDGVVVGAHLPGWWLPTHEHIPSVAKWLPPSGAATTGLAHGIAGPLAFLSIAAAHARTVPGQDEAIHASASWLLRWRHHAGPSWPAHISGDELAAGPHSDKGIRSPGRRAPWCYGAAGIGRALMLAGQALHDGELRRTGWTAIARLAQRPITQWDTDGPGLCHGTAGVLQAAHRAGCSGTERPASLRTAALLRSGNQEDTTPATGGLLTGELGAALALADSDRLLPTPRAIAWDVFLLLS